MTEPLTYIPGFYSPEKTLALYNACAKLDYPIRYSEPWRNEIRHRAIGWSEQPCQRLGDIGSERPLDTMPYEIRLLQCGCEGGDSDSNWRTGEREFDCRRCGYGESLAWITDEEGNRIGWRRDILYGCGAVRAADQVSGITQCFGLRSVQKAHDLAQRMRDDIANGKLDGEKSYVTRWNEETKQAEVIAGKWTEVEH